MHGDLFSFKPNHAIYIVGYILRNLFSFNFPPVSLKLQSVFVFCHNTVTLLVVVGGVSSLYHPLEFVLSLGTAFLN